MLTSNIGMAGLGCKSRVPARCPSFRNGVRCSATPDEAPRRRQVLRGLAAGLTLLPIGGARAATSIELFDRREDKYGLDRFQQAADFQEDIRVRRGEQQYRASVEDARKRMEESKQRLQAIAQDIANNRWSSGRNELRLQTGYLRYDLDVLSQASQDRREAAAANEAVLDNLERLDYALAKKDKSGAQAAHTAMLDSLASAMNAAG